MSTSATENADDERLDRVFGALSHRVRRAILARLADGALPVGALAAPFDMSLPAVSKHIRVLERAGLVARRVDGRVHRCALDPHPLGDLNRWLDTYRHFWDDQLAALARFVETPNEETNDDATDANGTQG